MVLLQVQQSVDLEPTSLELVASMESIGLSLVNNVAKHEVLYAGIVSGGPTWQWRKLTGNSKRFHNFKGREAYQLEQAFQKYKSNVEADIHIDASVKLEHSNLEVDFSQMTMSKPHHRQLQRIYEDGFWCRFKTSASQYQVTDLFFHKMKQVSYNFFVQFLSTSNGVFRTVFSFQNCFQFSKSNFSCFRE